MAEFVVDVGFSMSRPVVPDEFVSRVSVQADNDLDAMWVAMAMVSSRPGVQMPTSSNIVSVSY